MKKQAKNLIPITEEDIQEFIRQAELISKCSYLKNPVKKINITYDMSKGLNFGGDIPPRESVDSFLMILRPFIEYRERLHVGRIISYLEDTHGKAEMLSKARTYLDAKSQFPVVKIGEKTYGANEMMYLYLYGKYFHLEEAKQKAYRLIEENLGYYGEFTALSQLERFAGIVLMVAGVVKRYDRNLSQNDNYT
ncbi:MAG: hypothetical protein WC851_00265 [Candidatus Shapirobacteria bacterium]|jgi:hypothetical protein